MRASFAFAFDDTQKCEDTDVPLAKIVPCFPSGTLKSDEQQSTVAERPLLPRSLSYGPETIATGSWSWLRIAVPSRIAHPWTPDSGRRVSQVRLRGCCAEVPVVYCPNGYPEKLLFPVYRKQTLPAHLAGACFPFHSDGSRQCAEPSNDIKHASRGQAPASKFLLPPCSVRWRRLRAPQFARLREICVE
jgi:hypothetical protein